MRKILTVLGLLVLTCGLQAQTWDEWFKQRKTQRKYLAQQIAALQFYIGYLEKGYEIASAGLNAINSIKNGDFHLHDGFFNSLKWVKPSIRNSAAVANIILMQQQIVKHCRLAREMAGQFTSSEIGTLKRTVDRLLDDCSAMVEVLILIITSGAVEMKDDERVRRINMLKTEMENRYRFSRSMAEEMKQMALQRMSEQREVNRSRKIFGLN